MAIIEFFQHSVIQPISSYGSTQMYSQDNYLSYKSLG